MKKQFLGKGKPFLGDKGLRTKKWWVQAAFHTFSYCLPHPLSHARAKTARWQNQTHEFWHWDNTPHLSLEDENTPAHVIRTVALNQIHDCWHWRVKKILAWSEACYNLIHTDKNKVSATQNKETCSFDRCCFFLVLGGTPRVEKRNNEIS